MTLTFVELYFRCVSVHTCDGGRELDERVIGWADAQKEEQMDKSAERYLFPHLKANELSPLVVYFSARPPAVMREQPGLSNHIQNIDTPEHFWKFFQG